MPKVLELLKDTFLYGLSSVISRFITLLLLPLYTRVLSPDEYGVLNILTITFTLIWICLVMGLDSASFVFFHEKKTDEERGKIYATWFWTQIAISLFFAVLIAIFSKNISQVLFKTQNYFIEVLFLSGLIIVNILPNIVINYLRITRQVTRTIYFSLSQSVMIILLNILFILVLSYGVKGFFLAQFVAGFVFSLIGFFYFKNWFKFSNFQPELLKSMLKYAAPLVPTALATWGLNSAGGYFLQNFKGSFEVGIYQTGITLSGIVAFVSQSFTQAWGPYAISVKDDSTAKVFYSNVFVLYTIFLSFFAACISIFSNDILLIVVDKEFYSARWTFVILSFTSILSGAIYIAALGLNIIKDMKPFGRVTILWAFINLFLFYFGSRYFGKEGCAWASLIANLGVVFFIFRSAQLKYYIPYNFSMAGLNFFFSLLFSFLSVYYLGSEQRLFLKFGLLIALFTVLFGMNYKLLKSFKISRVN